MKFSRTLGIGAALALGLGLVVLLSLLTAHVEAGPAADIDDNPPAPESLLLAPQAEVIATHTLSIVPAFTAVGLGEVFTVSLVISDAQDLGGLEYTLEFSPSVVQGARVQLGDFPTSTGRSVVELPVTGDPISNVIGTVIHGFASFGALGDGPNGAGIIASIAFTATGGDTSPLHLVKAQATDTYARVLTPTILIDGQVVVSQPGVDVCCDSTQDGAPGAQVIHTFTLTNTGGISDSFTLAVAGNAWDTQLPFTNTGTLAPDRSMAINVTVDIPSPLPLDAFVLSDTFTLMATSDYLSTVFDTVLGTTNTEVEVTPGVALSADSEGTGLPGASVTHNFTVTNTGDSTDSFTLAIAGQTWTSTLSIMDTGDLIAGASLAFMVTVEIPSDASGNDFDVATVTAASGWDPAVTATAQMTTTVPVTIEEFWVYLPVVMRNQ